MLYSESVESFNCAGILLQVALPDDDDAYQYEDVTIVEGSPINSDLIFTANHSHLYVMTSDKVVMLNQRIYRRRRLYILWLNCFSDVLT